MTYQPQWSQLGYAHGDYRNDWQPSDIYMSMCIDRLPGMTDAKTALIDIKTRIKKQGKPADVVELDLGEIPIGKFTPEIKKVIESCTNLQTFSVAECDLTSLQNFPVLKKLKELDVSSNSLPDEALKTIATNCKKLVRLSFGDNKIAKLDSVKQLKGLSELEFLDCDDNPFSNEADYTKALFKTFKKLKYLDNKDKEGNEMIADPDDDDQPDKEEDDDEAASGSEQGPADEDDEDGEYQDQQEQSSQPEASQESQQSQQAPKKKKR